MNLRKIWRLLMNDAQKLDAILTAVKTPPVATVDVNALATAIAAALKPQFDAITASLADIQGQVDEPASSGSGASSASGTAAAKAS
jgi:hypothetical protein